MSTQTIDPAHHAGHGPAGGHHGDHSGHGGHGDHAAQFRDRFWVSLLLTVPVVATSHRIQARQLLMLVDGAIISAAMGQDMRAAPGANQAAGTLLGSCTSSSVDGRTRNGETRP